MNRTTIWQRMGALLLALVLVVGLLPVGAMAGTYEPGWNAGSDHRFTVELIRRGTEDNYTYSVGFGNSNIGANDVDYYWCDNLKDPNLDLSKGDEEIYTAYRSGDGTTENPYNFDKTHNTHSSNSANVGLKVVMDGLWVKITIPDTADETDLDTNLTDDVQDLGWSYTATWATKTTLPGTIQVGVPFALNYVFECAEVQRTEDDRPYMSCGVTDATVSFEDAFEGATVVKQGDGRYIATEKSGDALTLTRTVSTSGTTRGTEYQTAPVTETVITDVKINGVDATAGTTYVTGDTITLSIKCDVEDSSYLPVLGDNITWNKGDGIWTATVPEGTYTINGNTYTVAVDNTAMAFDGTPVAYVDGDCTYLTFDLVTNPPSGIRSVNLAGVNFDPSSDDGKWYTSTTLSDKQELTVTSNVGNSVTAQVDVIPVLNVTVVPNGKYCEGYSATNDLKVTTSYSGTLTIDGNAVAESGTGYIVSNGVTTYSGKTWTFTDTLGRTVSGTLPTYVVDTDAPTISITEKGNDGNELTELSGYRTAATDIVVTITDDGSGVDTTASQVEYHLKGEEKTQTAAIENGKATISLVDGNVLTKITVSAKDNLGNAATTVNVTGSMTVDTKAPEVSLTVSAKTDNTDNPIIGCFTNGGKNWLVLENPVESDADGIRTVFTVTMTVSDVNLPDMTDWTKNEDGTWKKDFDVATVSNHNELEVALSVPALKDMAGNAPATLAISIGKNQDSTEQTLELTLNGDNYEGKVYVDRRYPGGGTNGAVPTVEFSTEAEVKHTFGEGDDAVKLYNADELTFNINVTDGGSGLNEQSFDITLNDSEIIKIDDKNAAMVKLTKVTEGEKNKLILTLSVKDNVGNKWTYHHYFALDNLKPRVKIAFDKPYKHVENGKYYFKDYDESLENPDYVTATVTVEELNFSTDPEKTILTHTTKNVGEWSHNDGVHTITLGYNGDGDHKLSAVSTDLSGNSSEIATASIGEAFVLDNDAPTILVTQSSDDTEVFHNGDIHYHNHEKGVQYSITISDAHLTNDGGEAEVEYTIVNDNAKEESDKEKTVELGLAELNANEDNTVYTHTFTVEPGYRLTNLYVNAVDNAGNDFKINPSSTVGLFDENGNYIGGTVVVDTTPPEVTINKDIEQVNTVDGVDLYNAPVTYKIKVEDTNLDPKSSGAEYTGTYNYTKEDGNAPGITSEVAWEKSTTSCEGKFTIADAQKFTAATLEIADAAGNKPVTIGNAQWKIDEDGVIAYNSNPVVVDITPPKAELSFKCLTDGVELQNYYTNNSVAYLKISTPTTNDNRNSDDLVKVKATLTITDNNLSTKEKDKAGKLFIDDLAGGWTQSDTDYTVINNKNAVVTYTQMLSVKPNATQAVALNFLIQDLVSNKLEAVTVAPIEKQDDPNAETKLPDGFMTVDNGVLTGTITLDRRQPTTGNDTDVPYIKLDEPNTPYKTAAGAPLYRAETLSFGLTVKDGEKDKENAGLKRVNSTVNDEAKFITAENINVEYNTNEENKNYVRTLTDNIGLKVGTGENNNVAITVNAEDNIGNAIAYQKTIAVDTKAPDVVITCDNNEQPNVEGYFNKDRVVTIQVTDINFDADKVKIDAKNGAVSDWSHNGNTHTITVSYTKDGESSLFVEVKDRADNAAVIDYTKVACHDKFVIDKTLPVIHVHYNPAEESGIHNGVLFYNKEQQVTVTIDELNFQAKDVFAEFLRGGTDSGHTLSAFGSEGKVHRAYVTFENGNNYKFTVKFQDMAGNVAETYVSPSFSVDVNKPEIEILNANVSQDYVQPLAEDLELELLVTDKERNLSTCRLVLTHVNNTFEKTEVSGDVYYTRVNEEGYTAKFTFKDFPYEKLYDGVYVVELYAEDYAGNEEKLDPPIRFSMNRFGSTFIYGNEFTEEYLTEENGGIVYRNTIEQNLVIQEINPNRVYSDANKTAEGSSVTMVVNGESTLLKEGKDYKLTAEKFGGEGTNWYVYTYEINRDIFANGKDLVNGKYSIVLYGVDEAGNSNTNTLETVDGDEVYTAKMEFVLDTIAPVIITTGIESGEIYDATNKQMEIEIVDSTPSAIQVYLNGQLVSLTETDETLPEDTVWLVQDEITGIYTLNVVEDNALFSSQNVKIQALDAANNPAEEEVTDFTITTNWFVRFVNSGWLLILLAILTVSVVLIFVISKKKKKAVV